MKQNYKDYLKEAENIDSYNYKTDIKYHIIKNNNTIVLNVSSGYCFTLPTLSLKYDYEYSELRCKYFYDDVILTTSYEDKNPYTHMGKKGWEIYLDEWITRYISKEDYLTGNRISKVHENIKDENFLNQYELITFSYVINEAKAITHPYYNIAIIKEKENYSTFYLFVMKSKTNKYSDFERILSTFNILVKEGKACNIKTNYPLCIDPNWNEMTKKYFDKLCNQQHIDWGFFQKSIVNEKDGSYQYISDYYEKYGDKYEKLMDYTCPLFPTYMHISWQNHLHRFPMKMALKYAGGDGFNDKKILHFTFQYTANNNTSLYGYTPSLDILRGEFDEYFRQLAQDIKKYHYPILFRLNNEMNTDWTSYAGIASMLDPDIFILTWKRLFDIFKEEGVDNCIWIFNPFGVTTPFCNWGEYLNYYPKGMVHMLGLTGYERGNEEKLQSFEELYSTLYQKNSPYFDLFPQIISEFGCGAGGETHFDFEQGKYVFLKRARNQDKQTKWVHDMFTILNTTKPKYVSNIKAAIWFSVNDYAYVNNHNYIMNYFELTDEVMPTILEFKVGLNYNKKD